MPSLLLQSLLPPERNPFIFLPPKTLAFPPTDPFESFLLISSDTGSRPQKDRAIQFQAAYLARRLPLRAGTWRHTCVSQIKRIPPPFTYFNRCAFPQGHQELTHSARWRTLCITLLEPSSARKPLASTWPVDLGLCFPSGKCHQPGWESFDFTKT